MRFTAHSLSIFSVEEAGSELLVDLGTKKYGYIKVKTKNERDVAFSYGPFKDFTPLKNIMKAGASNESVCASLITARYFKIDNAGGDIEYISFSDETYQAEKKGKFVCDDVLLNKIFDICAATISLCVCPHHIGNNYMNLLPKENQEFVKNWVGFGNSDYVLVDGARRDREVWVGDLVPEVLMWWYGFGDAQVIKNSVELMLGLVKEDGYIPGSSVSWQTYYEYSAWFVVVFHQYVLLSGDIEYLEQHFDTLLKILDYLKIVIDSEGLMVLPKTQTWAYTMRRSGKIVSSNCVLARAYDSAAAMAGYLNKAEAAKVYSQKAQKLKALIFYKGYDKKKHAFFDVMDGEKAYSLDANSYAIISEICPKKYVGKTLESIEKLFRTQFGALLINPPEPDDGRNWPHNKNVWPFLVGFEAEARFKSGDHKGAVGLIKACHGNMAIQGTDTFWEIIDAKTGGFIYQRLLKTDDESLDVYDSASHGWSAGAGMLLQTYIGGISPLSPGFKTASFDPHLMGMKNIDCAVPAANGSISVKMKKISGESYAVSLSVPAQVELHYKGAGIMLKNGKKIKRLKSGEYILTDKA